jgi:uncharacterized protein (DUF2236 family)
VVTLGRKCEKTSNPTLRVRTTFNYISMDTTIEGDDAYHHVRRTVSELYMTLQSPTNF